jgi:hypothetical protein
LFVGDLLKALGVDYLWGRESVEQFNETFAGRLAVPSTFGKHQFYVKVDPYWANGTYVFC